MGPERNVVKACSKALEENVAGDSGGMISNLQG